jgi:hypothetical protein
LSFIPGSSFLFNAIESTKPTKLDGDRPLDIDGTQLAERFKHLQLDLNEEQENDRLKSIRPIKQLKKRQVTAPRSFNFQSQPLPPFAGSPKGPPILSTVKFAPINIPPPPSPPPPEQQQLIEEENQLNQDTATIKENISNCLITATSESGQDQSASIFYELEQLSPITTWHQLKMLNLSRQNLTSISDLSTCFPVLEYLQM